MLEFGRNDTDDLIRDILANTEERAPAKLATVFQQRLLYAATCGEEWAEYLLDSSQREGLRLVIYHFMKKEQGASVQISNTGEIVQLPARYSLQRLTKEAKSEGPFQLRLIMEMRWPDVVRVRNGIQRQSNRLGQVDLALKELLTLWDLYPDSQTPHEACTLAGINPDLVNLGQHA